MGRPVGKKLFTPELLKEITDLLEKGLFRVSVYSTVEGMHKERWDSLMARSRPFRQAVEKAEQVFFRRFQERWIALAETNATYNNLAEFKEYMGKRFQEMGNRQRVEVEEVKPMRVTLKKYSLPKEKGKGKG